MTYLQNYTDSIRERGNAPLAKAIEKCALEANEEYLDSFSFTSHDIGLLFGNVQSGKTGQMFGIMCQAADIGFPVFLVLTSDNVKLQQQTLSRAQNDLKDFCVIGENDSKIFNRVNLEKPVVVVIKKNVRMLKLWANILANTGYLRGNPLMVLDDEADNASLNTLVNKDRQSSINKYIASIKDRAVSSIYLQVTGTPQAILLQTMMSGFKPKFVQYFKPGAGYMGGDFFFPESQNKTNIKLISKKFSSQKAIDEFVASHLVSSAISLLAGQKVSNALAHPGIRKSDHSKTKKEIQNTLKKLKDLSEEELKQILEPIYDDLNPAKITKSSLEDVLRKAAEILKNDDYQILVMNTDHVDAQNDYSEGCNFIVGGNSLGRGVTFPNLNSFFYTRTSKRPQADTLWQHNRMFGYDRDPGLIRVFMDETLLKFFTDINQVNNSLIAQIEKGYDSIHMLFPVGVNPTRQNVIDNDFVDLIPGGTNFYPMDPDNKSIERMDKLLAPFDDKEPYHQVSLRLLKEILEQTIPSPDFPLAGFIKAINAILAKSPLTQAVLIVRRDRHVSQGTGALLSASDFAETKKHGDKTVLTMYEICGNHGWKQPRLWVPNIRLPENTVFYNVTDKDADED